MDKLPISLCMIVKNEERHLAACLESVCEWVDEIVVMDTGSTDATVDIARRFHANVYDHEWKNDFAEARNAALSKAKNPWLLQLDADEKISREDVPWFFESYPWIDAMGYYLNIHNLKNEQGSEVSLIHRLVRFYRNHPDIHYESAIHETLHISKSQVYNSPVRIIHKGYNHNVTTGLKRQRNLKILQTKLKDSPNNPFLLAYLAQHYQTEGKLDVAVKIAEKSLWYGVTFPMRRHLLQLCFEYSFARQDVTLLKKFFDMLPAPDVLPDNYYYQGKYQELNGDNAGAARLYQKYRQLSRIQSQRDNDSFIPEMEVDVRRREALINAQNGQFRDAVDLMQEAVKIAPSGHQLWAELGQYQFKMGHVELARSSFENVLNILEQQGKSPENEALKVRYNQLIEKLRLLILQ